MQSISILAFSRPAHLSFLLEHCWNKTVLNKTLDHYYWVSTDIICLLSFLK